MNKKKEYKVNKEKLKEDLVGIIKQDVATLTNINDKYNFAIKMYKSDINYPHINFFSKDGKYLICRLLLTDDQKNTKCFDIKYSDVDEDKIKNVILNWANDNDALGFNNWKWAKKMWRLLNKKPSVVRA